MVGVPSDHHRASDVHSGPLKSRFGVAVDSGMTLPMSKHLDGSLLHLQGPRSA